MSWYTNLKTSRAGVWFSKNKSIIPWITVIILIIVIILLWNREEKVIVVDEVNADLIREKKELTDKNNKTWAVLEATVISQSEVLRRNDSLARALGVKAKYIQGRDEYHYQTFIKVDTITTTRVIQVNGDSAYKAVYNTPWTNITAIAGPRTSSIEYESRDTLTRVETVKNPLIGRVTRQTLIRNANQDNKLMSGYSFSTKEKDVYLSIGPTAGVGFNGKNLVPIVGISIQYPIIKFRR